MNGDSGEGLAGRLQALRDKNADVTAALVVTNDGLPIESNAGPDVDTDALGALAADLIARAGRALDDFGAGPVAEILVKGEQGYVIVVGAGSDASLACLASVEASLGLLLLDIHRAAAGLGDLV